MGRIGLPRTLARGRGNQNRWRHWHLGRRKARRLRFQLRTGQREFGLKHQRPWNLFFFRRAPGEAITGRDRLKTGVGRIPFDLHGAARRVVGRIVGHRPDHDRVDAQYGRQPADFVRIVQVELIGVHRPFDDADRYHLESLDQLQLVEIGLGELPAVDRRLGAQIEEGRNRRPWPIVETDCEPPAGAAISGIN